MEANDVIDSRDPFEDNHNLYYENGTRTPGFPGYNDSLSMYDDPFSYPVSSAIVIIISYSLVFLACIIGNVLVLIVIIRNRRMRTLTNLFLANLAVADLCVGIVCIFPNMLKYLFLQWFLGKAMCKLFQFVVSMNVTASMLLLEVVAVERYIAINHPLKARRLFTRRNMYFAQLAIWMVSSVYNIPVIVMYDLHTFPKDGGDESNTISYCYPSEKYLLPNNTLATYDIVTFIVWYVFPLVVMTAMYASMAHTLRKSTLPNYIVPTLSTNRHVNASLRLSQTGKGADTMRKNDIATALTTASLRANIKTRSEQSLTSSATTFESSPSKQTKVNTELELSRIYTQHSLTLTKADQNALLQNQDVLKTYDSKPRIQATARSSLSSSSSTNSSKDDPFSLPNETDQLKEAVIVKEELRNSDNLDPLLNGKNSGGSSITPLTLRVSTKNSTSSCGSVTTTAQTRSTKSCRYRLTSQRASRRRVIRLLIIVLAAFAVLVLPHHLVLLLTTFHPGLGFGSLTGPLCDLVMFLNSAVNPVLYSLFSQSFRRNLKGAFRCCKCLQTSSRKRKPTHRPVRRTGGIVDNRFVV